MLGLCFHDTFTTASEGSEEPDISFAQDVFGQRLILYAENGKASAS